MREEFGPTPHVVYIVCPSSQPKEMQAALVEASLVLQECATTVNVASGVSIAAPTSGGSAPAPGASAAQADGVAAEQNDEAAVNVNPEQPSDYIQIQGTAKAPPLTPQGPRLQLLTVQVRLHSDVRILQHCV